MFRVAARRLSSSLTSSPWKLNPTASVFVSRNPIDGPPPSSSDDRPTRSVAPFSDVFRGSYRGSFWRYIFQTNALTFSGILHPHISLSF
ncbi:hypothetical protein QJS10_CPB22g01270 [Acorus calamus]|uniref:Uncharacterized protein n=1 Tax=Acorus calamus TaxID=4465 RepID=A0AAV9C2B0_ACOCL|nr:hypothetical protein QJS10_CPB22g01270 [Acorus calamus]